MALIRFKQGLAANYAALQSKDANTLYFLTDSKEIYFGENRLGNGTAPTLVGKTLTIAGTSLDLTAFQTAEEVSAAISAAIAAIGSVYVIKGTATVSQINALDPVADPATVKAGDVYNVSDSGTITQPTGATLSDIDVLAGDNVVYTSAGWDKLAGTVDLSNYYTKAQVDAEFNNVTMPIAQALNDHQTAIAGKMDKVSSATAGDIATLNASGEATDSGKSIGGATLSNSPSANVVATEAAVSAALTIGTIPAAE